MTYAKDKALHAEYLEYIDAGATNVEALIQVATTNELSAMIVFDSLVRFGLHNPCMCSDADC